MRTIGVVTVARSDYSLYRPLLREIQKNRSLRLRLFVGGAHLSPEFGHTVLEIEKDAFPIEERIEMLMSSDTPAGVAQGLGVGVMGFSRVFARTRPDVLVLLGDRWEMFAAAAAAVPFNIPLAHIHGGESTEGAIDEALRHAMTKMSHLHFVALPRYRNRLIRMGEDPRRVFVTGAPALDNFRTLSLLGAAALAKRLNLRPDPPPLLVTYHPSTLTPAGTERRVRGFLRALGTIRRPMVISYPNADAQGRTILQAFRRFEGGHPGVRLVPNLGPRVYYSLLRWAGAMVGNSSSGIIEAASFGLPVLNVGDRQRGRWHGANVVDVGDDVRSLRAGLARVLDPAFRRSLRGMANPYGDGNTAPRIVQVLATVDLGPALTTKKFFEAPDEPESRPGSPGSPVGGFTPLDKSF